MELFAVHIADVRLLGRAGCRRVGGVQRGICRKVLGAHGVVLAVTANGDGALQVGAVHIHPGIPQDAQGLLVRVAVLVVHAAGDDAHFRQHRVQEEVAGGGAGTVVAHLQHIGSEVRAAVHKVGLRSLFHVAGQQETGGAVVDAQHEGGIVGIAVLCHRAKHGHGSAAQRPHRAHGGHLYLQALLLGVLDKILKALGGGIGHRAVHMVRREVGQCGSQAAYMILVGVGAEHIFQLFHPLTLQVRDDETAVVHIAAVVEHELSVAFHQHTQCLTHIDEMHLQGCVHCIHSRRSRSGRVRHYIGASARDGRQPAAARKAQHQCGGSGQRSKALPQAFLRRVYFFFFPVFHVAFSFC